MPTPTLNQNALTTVSRAQGELGISGSSDDIRRWINEVSQMIEQECNRHFYYLSEHDERTEGYGGEQLLISDHVPIDQIREIIFDDGNTTETIDADDYEVIRPEEGMIRRVNGTWRDTREERVEIARHQVPGTAQRLYKITYDGGWITPQQDDDGVGTRDLPYDIERAALEYVALQYARSGSNPLVTKTDMSNASVSFAVTSSGQKPTRPKSVDHVIKRYMNHPMA